MAARAHHEPTEGELFESPLVHAWLPALEAAERRLRRGARVAEVGVAAESAAVRLALAYPDSTFHGFDADPTAVVAVREAIARAGVSDRVTYEVLTRSGVAGSGYDLVRSDSGRTRGRRGRVRSVLASGGVVIDTGGGRATIATRTSLVPAW